MGEYLYRGARSSVLLHEVELRRFLAIWNKAKSSGLELSPVDDPDYASLDAIAAHVFRWARTYMIWICEQLDLPEPGIDPVPGLDCLDSEAADYADHLLQYWGPQLETVPAKSFFKETYTAPWGIPYCIDAMLEHAVMHPVKHRFQLEEWLGEVDLNEWKG